jgi:regulator of protease activity HflC (stomatin/prohibitin superfamily)
MDWTYILALAVILYLLGSIRVLRQYERGVVFILGKFEGVRGAGLTLVFVPIQQMVRVSLRTVTMQIPSQKIITRDNVSIDIAAVAYYHISDPEKAVIVIENVSNAINQISQTTVRNVVGRFSLDQLLSDTASINEQIKNVIDGHTEPWGTQVTAVEIKDITLPDNMQRAMAKEAEAERERRAKIVAAEGEYQSVTFDPQGSEGAQRIPRVRPDPQKHLPCGPRPRHNRRSIRAQPPEAGRSGPRRRTGRPSAPTSWHVFCMCGSSERSPAVRAYPF